MCYLRSAMLAIAIACAAVHTASASEFPFGSARQIHAGDDVVRMWALVSARMDVDLQRIESCKRYPDECGPDGHAAIRHFDAIVESARGKEGRTLLDAVNRVIKAHIKPVTRKSDKRCYGEDRWLSPFDLLNTPSCGDCEDAAILAIAVLQVLGWPADDLALLLVRSKRDGEDHAFVGARLNGEWLIIESRVSSVLSDDAGLDTILTEAKAATFYRPMFFLNHIGTWQYPKAATNASAR